MFDALSIKQTKIKVKIKSRFFILKIGNIHFQIQI